MGLVNRGLIHMSPANRFINSQGQILTVWTLAAKLANSDLIFAVDFWVYFSSWVLSMKKVPKSTQKSPRNLFGKVSNLCRGPFLNKLPPSFVDSALCQWEKQTNPQRIVGPRGVYRQGRGWDVNWPLSWNDEVGPLLSQVMDAGCPQTDSVIALIGRAVIVREGSKAAAVSEELSAPSDSISLQLG